MVEESHGCLMLSLCVFCRPKTIVIQLSTVVKENILFFPVLSNLLFCLNGVTSNMAYEKDLFFRPHNP